MDEPQAQAAAIGRFLLEEARADADEALALEVEDIVGEE